MPWVLPTNGIDTLLTITNYRDYTTGRGGDTPIELIVGYCRVISLQEWLLMGGGVD